MTNTIFFDVETTGLEVSQGDRIVQIAYKVHGKEPFVSLVHPQRRIPKETSDIHGIKDEDVAMAPTFPELMPHIIQDFMQATVLCAYNGSFDLTFLAEEFGMAGVEFPAPHHVLLDPYKIMAADHPRTLANCYKTYIGHDADADKLHDAAYDTHLLEQITERMIERTDGDAHSLAVQFGGVIVDAAGKLTMDDDGEIVYAFGKHKGVRVADEKSYARWMLGADFPQSTKAVLRRLIA